MCLHFVGRDPLGEESAIRKVCLRPGSFSGLSYFPYSFQAIVGALALGEMRALIFASFHQEKKMSNNKISYEK